MKKIKIPKKIRQFFKKLTTLETYEDLLVAFLKFFIKRNPASPIYALTKIISPKLNFGVPRSSTSEKTFSKTFSEHCQYFSFRHPYISAGTSFVLIVSIITGTFGFLFFGNTESTAAWSPTQRVSDSASLRLRESPTRRVSDSESLRLGEWDDISLII